MRDVGGIPTTDGGRIAQGRLLRSDNLQSLTERDIAALRDLHVTDVIDLRSHVEVASEGDGPLRAEPGITFHHLSFFVEDDTASPDEVASRALPWLDKQVDVQLDNPVASTYVGFIADRPDSVVGALRAIADAEGAALVHCAAGKDRTGTTVALALLLAGAERDAVIADYAASSQRTRRIVDRLLASSTYRHTVVGRPLSSHDSVPETMQALLTHIDEAHGDVETMLEPLGWTADDTRRLRLKLLEA